MSSREVPWGDALYACAFRYPGGVKRAVEQIHLAVGPAVGSRASFQKLRYVIDPAELAERDRLRAWLLLEVFGEDPAAWGVADPAATALYGVEDLRRALRRVGKSTAATRTATARYVRWFRTVDLGVPPLAIVA